MAEANSSRGLIIIGLGAVARTHLQVLQQIADVAVLAGVDPAAPQSLTFRGREIPVYATVQEAAANHAPSLVVIATPSRTHTAVCDEVARSFPQAAILVEKPAADSYAGAHHLLAELGGRQPVDVAFHMAFSPEVRWGARLAESRADVLGSPISIVASFADPYEPEFASARHRFGNSWIDSGINALSVLDRFVELRGRRSLRSLGPESWSAFEARVTCRAGTEDFEALILTSWHVTAPSRTTRITFSSGADLILDHHGVAGHLIEQGTVREFLGSDGSTPRRESHYRALYDWYLKEGRRVLPPHRSLRLHDVLLRPEPAP